MTLSPWLPLLLALPVLWLGERLVARFWLLGRFNIPAPVVGGLILSALVLALNLGGWPLRFTTQVNSAWWTWVVTIEPEWLHAPGKSVTLPLMVAFFTCIGLNATWDVVRKGSIQVVVFLFIATVLAAIQNGVGVALARALRVDPLLGLVCGSVTMTGGHGTAIGFAPAFEKLGLASATVLGAAAATVGLITGGLLGGPIGSWLIRRLGRARVQAPADSVRAAGRAPAGIGHDFRAIRAAGFVAVPHVLLVLLCVKAGAWVSYAIELSGIKFTPQIGAMVLGVIVRNAFDLSGRRWIRSEVIDLIASVALGLFLTTAMMSLNLIELAYAAGPMLVILAAQVVVMAVFAVFVTYVAMGRDYDAAVMAGGHCGFGLGATPNAVANMKSLVEAYGPAPRAFLVVPVVGAILIDFTNALVITFSMNVVR